MFGNWDSEEISRAHQLPRSPASRVFWGMVCELVSGCKMDGYPEDKKLFMRTEMAEWMSQFKTNLFPFADSHNSVYNLLEDSHCVMLIPLLNVEGIAKWKEGEGYEVLLCCSDIIAQQKIGNWRQQFDLSHLKWEDKGDLELATES